MQTHSIETKNMIPWCNISKCNWSFHIANKLIKNISYFNKISQKLYMNINNHIHWNCATPLFTCYIHYIQHPCGTLWIYVQYSKIPKCIKLSARYVITWSFHYYLELESRNNITDYLYNKEKWTPIKQSSTLVS